MAKTIFGVLVFLLGIVLVANEAIGKDYYRWMDDDGVVQLSDQPPVGRAYQTIWGLNAIDSQSASPVKEAEDEASEKVSQIEKRREEVLKDLQEKIARYSDVGGITAGKLAALKEAAEVVEQAKMDGSSADDEFYAKIEELVRSIRDRTHIIGRVNRLLNEAKEMKGPAAPQKDSES
jgi:tetrahydromethanopterin S-methyltransferase subunit F